MCAVCVYLVYCIILGLCLVVVGFVFVGWLLPFVACSLSLLVFGFLGLPWDTVIAYCVSWLFFDKFIITLVINCVWWFALVIVYGLRFVWIGCLRVGLTYVYLCALKVWVYFKGFPRWFFV